MKGCHLNLELKLNEQFQQVVFAGVCLFVCMYACVLVCVCACVWCLPQRPYHLLTHLLPSKTEPPLFSCLLIKARSSHSCRFPFPACVPLPLSSWSGSHSTATTPLVSLCCPGSKTLLVSYHPWKENSCGLADVSTGAASLGRNIKD